ncbi:TetR/AcrR family transcriptional regulator [Chryseobacterium sp. MMS23-Vi53]|uniref:TetR/AcrR family transcriptional regulator n=1 Tax=Chryseobacterium sp. MMS23-Vi53 TaxID=3386644 RepID=UPI0039EA8743
MARNVEFNEAEAIQKAMQVFWKKGYNATSMRDLTDAMKINSSSLYNTIGDKHQLFLKCLSHYTDLRKKDFQRRTEKKDLPINILLDFLNDAVKSIVTDPNACMAVKTAFEIDPDDKAVQYILKEDSQFTRNFLIDLITKAIDSEALDKDVSPDVLADFIVSTYSGWYEMYIINKDPQQIRRMADFFIKQIIK